MSALNCQNPAPFLSTLHHTDEILSYHLFKDHRMPIDRPESWYSHRIWHPIFDRAFECIPSIQASRREISCQATRQQRNQRLVESGKAPRSRETRVAPGSRLDAIFHRTDRKLEYGVMEVSTTFDNQLDRKWNADRLQTTKTMRNLLVSIERTVRNALVLRKAPVVGIVAAGISPNQLHVLDATCPNHLSCRLSLPTLSNGLV